MGNKIKDLNQQDKQQPRNTVMQSAAPKTYISKRMMDKYRSERAK